MAQVKKLESGGTSPSNTQLTSKKRMYNGVELTDDDINNIISKVGDWGSKSSNYSEDIRGWGELGNKVKSQMLQGIMPEFSTTGTGMTLGNINVSEGKTNQNVFGNWSGEKLNRQYVSKLKEALDQYITPSNTETTETTNVTNTSKNHKNISKVISDKYFRGNWENAQKGISDWDINTRKNRIRESLVESINDYKSRYNEDSPYSSKINELNDPNISPEKLKEIAYSMGIDVSEYLENTGTGTGTVVEEIDTTSNLGRFLQSKGWKYVKDKDGKFKPVQGDNPSDLQEGVVKDFGEFYGYGLFKDSTGELKFGKKKDFEGTDLFSKVNAAYSEIFAGNQSNIAKGLNSIDYNNYNNPIFTKLDKYRTNNVFDYYDLSNQFTGIKPNQRLYVPKTGIKFDDLGNIDIDNSELFLYDDSAQKLERINPNMSYNSNILAGKYNLGTIGTNPNTLSPLKNTQETYRNTLDQKAPEFTPNDISKAVNLLKGWSGATIGSNNALRFLTDAINNKYASGSLEPYEKQLLANYMSRIFTKYVNRNAIGPQFMSSLQSKIDELLGNKTENGATSSFKKGGIIKAQVGAMISNQKTTPVKVTKTTFRKVPSQSIRARDLLNGSASTADYLDVVALGGDAASLAGGVVGIAGGVTATGAQLVADVLRKESFATTASNLGINLGFTLLAAIPGLGLTKGAIKAAKVADKLNDAKKVLKNVENGEDVLKQAKNVVKLAEKAETSKTAKKAFGKLFSANEAILPKKESLNVATRVLATGSKGFVAGLGVTGALNSIPDMYKDVKEGGLGAIQSGDIRGTLGLAGVGKMAYGHLKKQALKGVTNPSSVFKAEPIEVNVKGVEGINKVKIDKYTNAKDLEPQIKLKVNAELDNKIEQLKNSKTQTEETTKEIAKLESLKDKATLDMGWWNKQGKHLNNVKNSAKESTSNFWRDNIINDLSKRTYNPEKLGSTKWMDKLGNKLAAKNGYLNFDEDVVEQSIKESVKKVKKPRVKKVKPDPKPDPKPFGPRKLYNSPTLKVNKIEPKLPPLSQILGSPFKLPQRYAPAFKQGGQLIPKFQNSGKITKGTTDKPLKELQKRNIDIDTTLFRELPKLTHTLLGNRKNAQILSKINPVLMQAPTEIYKPVVTNLANENFVNNQVNSYLHQASKPMTSDASLQKGIQLEALSKTTPMLIQAKAANTDMYNQTLGLSNDSAEIYANVRNEVANSNRERIGAHQARLANIESGKNVADVASYSNSYDKANEVAERNKMYKFQSDTEKKLQDLQSEFSSKLKPFEENYNKLSDIKNSNIYKYKKDFAPDIDLNSTEGRTDGKTWSKAIEEEKEIKYKDWMNKRDELTPYYQSQFLNLRNRNPYLTKFSIGSYKSGGELTARSKVEVKQLKNKLKEKELDIKYRDKALDRKQKEVSSILNGLSKETFFLLKTLLGK